MIQLSNPILAPEIPFENHLEDTKPEGIYGAQENKKPGLFARLLENLKAISEASEEKNAADNSVASFALAGENPNVVKTAKSGELEIENSETHGFFVEAAGHDIPDAFAFINLDLLAEQNLSLQSILTENLQNESFKMDHDIAEKNGLLANFKETSGEEPGKDKQVQTGNQADQLNLANLKTENQENSEQASQLKDQFRLALYTPKSQNTGDERAATLNVSLMGEKQHSEKTLKDFSAARFLDQSETTPKDTDLRFSENRDRRGRFNVQVHDLRTEQIQAVAKETGPGEMVKSANTEIEIPVYLKNVNGEAAEAKQTGSQNSIYNARFEDVLAQEIRGNLSTDIVRDATFIIRNGGEGTIRLALHPASLGDVKIRLEMSENKITGQIIVQSSEAYRAFEREISVLERAFRDAGYSETSLEMSLAQDQWNFGADQEAVLAEEQRQEIEALPLYQLPGSSSYETESQSVSISALSERKAVNLLI